MSAAEIAHRARAALRDRLLPPAWSRWSAAEAGTRLFPVHGAPLDTGRFARVAHLPPAHTLTGTLAAARNLAAGRWSRFGAEVALEDPPRWNVNPATGAAWPEGPSARLDYRRTDLAGGAKGVWETGRLTMLPTLALADRLEPGAGHGARALRWLSSFATRNPLGHGIHHASGIEMAIRNLTISWSLALLDAPNARPASGLVAQQALWCRDHLSLGSSANNHLLAEYAAMVVAGAGFPRLAGAERLLDQGLEGLARELPLQIHADGVTAEQALRYLPFVWELVLPALALAEAAGRSAPDDARARLAASLEFARALRRSDGTLPPIGDEDDARVLLADEAGSRLDLAGNALAAWLGGPGLSDDAQALAHLLTGRAAAAARVAEEGVRTFEAGGCTVWRSGAAFATFDHGPLGLGSLAAHGHADALSITLRLGPDDLIVDPGTLAYHEDEPRRAATRATPSHSTVHFGGRSQSEMLGPFLWGRRAQVAREGEGRACRWWSGEAHVRTVRFAAGAIEIEDRLEGPAPELVFALAPAAEVRIEGARAVVTSGASRMTLESDGIEPWRLEPCENAPSFGVRRKASRLAAACRERTVPTRLSFGPR